MSTVKKEAIIRIAEATVNSELTADKLILVTAIGIISGRLVTKEQDADKLARYFADSLSDVRDQFPPHLDENDGYMLLKDVIINPASKNAVRIPYLTVFFDQIIGVTIADSITTD